MFLELTRTTYVNGATQAILVAESGEYSGLFGTLLAVSYTHLDVYKRQEFSSLFDIGCSYKERNAIIQLTKFDIFHVILCSITSPLSLKLETNNVKNKSML